MTTIVYPLCASIHLIALLYRAPRLLRSRMVADLSLLGIFVFSFLVWFFVLPWFWGPWSRAVGIPNFAGLLSHASVIVAVACQQILILHLSHNDPHVEHAQYRTRHRSVPSRPKSPERCSPPQAASNLPTSLDHDHSRQRQPHRR